MSSLLGSLTVLISASTVGFAKAARDIRVIDRAVQASTAGMTTGVAATGAAVQKTGQQAAAASAAATAAAKQTNAMLMSVGRTMTQFVTLPLGILGIVAAKTFSDFEYSLAKITGLVGIASDQTAQWGEEILNMAGAVGKGPTELAEALYFITSSGFKSAESLDILNTSAKAAASGLGETKTVANVVTSALNAYKQSSLSAAEATDILVNTVREGKGEADQMVASMGVILPISSKLGVSFDSVGAAMAAMTRTGSTAATSAVQLRQILFTLLKPAKHSREALAAMGTSSEELRKTLREDGLLATLMEVKRLIDTFGEETAGEIFPNIRALSGTLEIIGENLEDNKKIFESLANSTGMADAAFEAVSDTYKFKLRAALAEGSVMMVRFGEAIAQVLIPVLESLQRIFKDVGNWFNGLSDSTQNFIVKAAGIVVVLGPLIALRSAYLSMKMAILAPLKAIFGLTAALETQNTALNKSVSSVSKKAAADSAASAAAAKLAVSQKIQTVTTEQAAAAQVRAEVAAFEYAKAQMAARNATAFAAKTQEFAARTQINAATAQQIAKDKIIATDVNLIKAEEAAARAQALTATATRNGVFAAEALAYAKQQEAAAVAEAAAAEARATAIIKSGTVVTLSQRTATTQAAVALEAATLAKKAAIDAEIALANAKKLEIAATYEATRATQMAAAAEATAAKAAAYRLIKLRAINKEVLAAAAAQKAATKAAQTAAKAPQTFLAYTGGRISDPNSANLLKNIKVQNMAMVGSAAAMKYTTGAIVKTTTAMTGMQAATLATTRVFQGLAASMAANPWTWAIAAGAAIYFLVKHLTKLTELEQLQKDITDKVADSIANETAQLNGLLAIAQNEYVAKQTRLEAIKKINDISPLYLSNINEETVRTGQAKVAIDKYNESLAERIRMSALQEMLIENEKEYTKAVIDGSNKRVKGWSKAGLILSSPLNIKDWIENNDNWKKTIKEKEKINADSAKAIYEVNNSYILNELADRRSITEQMTRQYDAAQAKIDQVMGKEKEYQALLGKTGKDRTDAIKRAGEDFAKRLLKGGEGNTEADLIKEIGEGQQELLIATTVELEGLLNSMMKEKDIIEKSLRNFGVSAPGLGQGPLKNKPANVLPLPGIGGAFGINNIQQMFDLPKINEMIGGVSSSIGKFTKYIKDANIETSAFSTALKDFLDIISLIAIKQQLFGKTYDASSDILSAYRKRLDEIGKEAKKVTPEMQKLADTIMNIESAMLMGGKISPVDMFAKNDELNKLQKDYTKAFEGASFKELEYDPKTNKFKSLSKDMLQYGRAAEEVSNRANEAYLDSAGSLNYLADLDLKIGAFGDNGAIGIELMDDKIRLLKKTLTEKIATPFDENWMANVIDAATKLDEVQAKYESMKVWNDALIDSLSIIGTAIGEAASGAEDAFKNFAQAVLSMTGQIVGALLSIALAKTVVDKGLVAGLVVATVGIAAVLSLMSSTKAKATGMKTGGIIPQGYPNDSFPAMLTSGEMVVPQNKTKEFLDVVTNRNETINTVNNSKTTADKVLATTSVKSYEDIMSIPTTITKTMNDGNTGTKIEDVAKMKSGGTVPQGYPNDTFPALLTSGEMVVPKDKVNSFEKILQDKKNALPTEILRLKKGGKVEANGTVKGYEEYFVELRKAEEYLINYLKGWTGEAVEYLEPGTTPAKKYGKIVNTDTREKEIKNIDSYVLNTDAYKKYAEALKQFNEFEKALVEKTTILNSPDFRPGNIKINDTRNIKPGDKKSHLVNEETVREIVSGSLERGLKPDVSLAMALQETGIRNFNPLHNNSLQSETALTEDPLGIQGSLDFMKRMFDSGKKLGYKTDAEIIQSWNGYGPMPIDAYGAKKGTLMSENPLYGKRITALRDSAIQTTPEIMKIIREEVLKYKGQLEQSIPKKNDQLAYDKSLGTSLTGVGDFTNPFKEQKPLYDLSRFGIGEPAMSVLTSIENNTKPILDGISVNGVPGVDNTSQLLNTVNTVNSGVSSNNVINDIRGGIETAPGTVPGTTTPSLTSLEGASEAVSSLGNTVQSFLSILGADESLSGFFETIGQGSQTLGDLGNVLNTVTQLSAMFKAAQAAQAAATAAGIPAAVGAVGAQEALATANTNVAVTGAAASTSWIPIVGVALAIAGVAAMIAMLVKSRKKPAKMATGGLVPQGYPNDTFPALLTSGELVVPKEKVKEFSSIANSQSEISNFVNSSKQYGEIINKDSNVTTSLKDFRNTESNINTTKKDFINVVVNTETSKKDFNNIISNSSNLQKSLTSTANRNVIKNTNTANKVVQTYEDIMNLPTQVTTRENAVSATQINKQVNTLNEVNKAGRTRENTLETVLNTNNNFKEVMNNTRIPEMASGGIVPQGYPNDSYPAWLSSGETVIPPNAFKSFEKEPTNVNVVIEGKVKGQDIHYIVKEVERRYKNSY